METIVKIMLQVHIAAGVLVLITGSWQMIGSKGGKRHRIVGQTYFYGMTVIFVTAIPLCFLDPDMVFFGRIFLGAVSLFSYYFALMGMRFGRLKNLKKPEKMDKVIASAGLISWMFMVGIFIWCLFNDHKTTGIILGVFSIIFGATVIFDFRRLVWMDTTEKVYAGTSWLKNHNGRIMGSYIAAITAFCANVQPFPLPVLNWVLPSALGFIFIPYFARQIRRMLGEIPRTKA